MPKKNNGTTKLKVENSEEKKNQKLVLINSDNMKEMLIKIKGEIL